MEKERIIAVRKDNLGRLVEFKTDKNNIYNYEMAKEAVLTGKIINAEVFKGKDTLLHIKKKSIEKNDSFDFSQEF